ncbi:MAG: hypothetical protein IPJ77_06205 [Planctomycetes bacterium]|nr:hypothetical protein [Planctomycetota bacterium]
MRRLLPILVALAAACAATGPEPALRLGVPGLSADVESELRVAQGALQSASSSARAWCDLGEAWLAAARGSYELEAVRRARASFVRARVLARGEDAARARRGEIEVDVFRERISDALALAERARADFPSDAGLVAARIVALLASERPADARAALEELERNGPPNAELRARVELANGAVEAAGRLLDGAPGTANAARAQSELAAALVRDGKARAALERLERDAGRTEHGPEARRVLELARAATELAIAEAEKDERFARAALERCTRLRAEAASPIANALAARAARALGAEDEARWFAHAAEVVLRRAAEAGELYALGPLARLLVDTGGDLDEASEFARRWAQGTPRVEARALVEHIELLRARR